MPRLLLAILLLHYSSAEAADPIESLFTQVREVFNEENSSERCDESTEDQNFPCLPSLINDISEKAENLPANSLPILGVGGGSPPNSYTRRDATGEVLVEDWYTDVPWHQKLSTKDSNLIDTPFLLPFAAIPENLCPSADSPVAKSRCMLRYGIVNVMSMRRTDTLYNPGEAPYRR